MRGHYSDILRLAIPSIVSNVTVPLLGLVDVAIVGHIGDAVSIGAIAVGSMVFNVTYWIFGFLRMGTSGLTSQALGALRPVECMRVWSRAMSVALGIGLLLLICQWLLWHGASALISAEEGVNSLARRYFNICIWGAPAMLLLTAQSGWFIGMQNTRAPMVVAISQNVVNILLSALFVFVMGMGIEGVALGTLSAQWFGLIMSLFIMHRYYGKWRRHLCWRGMWQDGALGRFFRVNSDIFLRTLCLVSVNLFFLSAGARQGAIILAVNTLLMQLFLLFSYVMDGFAFAGEALAGKYSGADNPRALRGMTRCLLVIGAMVTVVFTSVYVVGGEPFLSLLTSDAIVVSAAVPYMPWAWLVPVCGVLAFVWDGIFIGLTATRGMLLSSTIATVLFFVVYLLLRPAMGNHALWLAFLVFLLTRGVVQSILGVPRIS